MGVTWTDTDSSSGETINASLINNIRDDIGSYLTTGIPNADLANPEHLVVFGPICLQTLSGGETEKFTFKTLHALEVVALHYGFEADGSGNPTLSVELWAGGTDLITGAVTTTTPDTLSETLGSAMSQSSIAANDEIVVHIDETAGGGNDLTNVCVTLICKAEHTT